MKHNDKLSALVIDYLSAFQNIAQPSDVSPVRLYSPIYTIH
jgi:hypothetical protein